MIGRREFVILLGGAAAAWPLDAGAQQPAVPVVGFLSSVSPAPFARMLAGFRQGLGQGGFIEGQNVAIEYRWADGHYDRLPAMAANLVHHPVAVLTSSGGEPAAQAAKAATTTIPIVANFSIDPVASGLVASLNRPGGNITGISSFTATLEPKRLSLLHLVAPQAATIGVLLNPNFVHTERQLKEINDSARTLGLRVQVLQATTDREIDAAFDSVALLRLSALMVQGDPFFDLRREQLVASAARQRVPVMYSFRDQVVGGGLMSYGVDRVDIYRQNGIYVSRILKGAKPADLPIVQPTKFEFMVNLKTAKALGIKFSDDLLSIADEVIE